MTASIRLLNIGTTHVDTSVLDNLPPEYLQPDFLFRLPGFRFPTRLNGATELIDRAVRDKGWMSRLAILAPGGVRWRYSDLDATVARIRNSFSRSVLKASSDDRLIGSSQLAFTFELGGRLLLPLQIGAATVLLDQDSPPRLARAISEYQATVCFSASTGYRIMATELDCDFSTLRKCVSAEVALSVAPRELWKRRTGIDIIDGLGTTEMLHIFVSMSGEDGAAHSGAVGKAILGYEVTVLDARGRQLPTGKAGRLAVKGPTGCRYLADDRQRDYVEAGWNLTGDTGWLDERGHFFYQAHTDDLIVSAGYNISPVGVEGVMLTHPAMRECAVVGLPDHKRGMIVKEFVVLGARHEASQDLIAGLQAFTKGVLAPYKYPRAIEFCTKLLRTETGKTQRLRCVETSARERSQVRPGADGGARRSFMQEKLIRFHHCDPAGIVFYPNYLILMNEVLQDWFQTALRIDYGGLFLERRIGIPTVRLECDFLAPSRLGDTVHFSVGLHRIGTTSFELRFVCVGAGQSTERVRLRAVLVCTSLDDQRPIPIPADIRAAMRDWASSEDEAGAV